MWTAAILLGVILVLWFVFANPKVLLWLFLLALAGVVYYGLYLIVRARLEGFDEG